jgi:CBS domain-containing protein
MSKPVTIKDFMIHRVITLSPDMDVLDAGKIFIDNGISGAPVIDKQGRLVGIITEKDFFKTILTAGYHGELGGKVSDYMSTNVETVSPDMNVLDLSELFLRSKYRRFPVVTDNKLVGVVGRRDLLKALFTLSWPPP